MTTSINFVKELADAAIDKATGGTGGSITVGYCTGATVDANGVITGVTGEPVGVGGYTTVTINDSDMPAATRVASTQEASVKVSTTITWPTATADQGTFTHSVLRRSTGAIYAVVLLTTPIDVLNGSTPSVQANTELLRQS